MACMIELTSQSMCAWMVKNIMNKSYDYDLSMLFRCFKYFDLICKFTCPILCYGENLNHLIQSF